MRALIATLTALMLFAATPVVAGGLEDAAAAYKARDYQKAFRLLKPHAEQGLAEAQTMLGLMYGDGNGVPQDHAKAVHWYTKAAKQGDVASQFNLGLKYAKGNGVPEDHAKAVHWFTKAAKQGLATAQTMLGGMYAQGKGIPEDHARAYAWLSIAAAQGNAGGKKFKEMLAKFTTPAQIAEGQKLSRELWEKYVVPFQKE
jgi:TPR repeat protein